MACCAGTIENKRRSKVSSARRHLSSLSYSHQNGSRIAPAPPCFRSSIFGATRSGKCVNQPAIKRLRASSHCCARCRRIASLFAAAGLLLASTTRQRLLPLPRSVRLGRRMRVSTVGSIQAIWLESTRARGRVAREQMALCLRFALAVDGGDVTADHAALRHQQRAVAHDA